MKPRTYTLLAAALAIVGLCQLFAAVAELLS